MLRRFYLFRRLFSHYVTDCSVHVQTHWYMFKGTMYKLNYVHVHDMRLTYVHVHDMRLTYVHVHDMRLTYVHVHVLVHATTD